MFVRPEQVIDALGQALAHCQRAEAILEEKGAPLEATAAGQLAMGLTTAIGALALLSAASSGQTPEAVSARVQEVAGAAAARTGEEGR